MRAKFYDAYFGRYLRPIRDFVWFNMERMLPLLSSPLGNFIPSSTFASLVGIVDTPKVKRRAKWSVIPCSPLEAVANKPSLAILQDSFTSFFRPQVIEAFIAITKHLGHNAVLLEYQPSGKVFHVRGNLQSFKDTALANTAWLKPVHDAGIPIVGLEPATTLLWRDEYLYETGEKHRIPVMLPQEWLITQDLSSLQLQGKWRLFPHCIEKAQAFESQKQWKCVFEELGAELELIETACCGMGGLFGHEREHQQQSLTIWEQHWMPHEPQEENSLVTGYSCQSQAMRVANLSLHHPLEIITSTIPSQ